MQQLFYFTHHFMTSFVFHRQIDANLKTTHIVKGRYGIFKKKVMLTNITAVALFHT